MMILRFTVANHKSIRDETTLDLVKPSLKTLRPAADQQWTDHTHTVAAIFGANASGKSALLDALSFMREAVQRSSSRWQELPVLPHHPFLLDDTHPDQPSTYELDFVHRGHRYLYGFQLSAHGIDAEWLKDIPRSRWRTLFKRESPHTAPNLRITGHSTPLGVSARELALSRAAVMDVEPMASLARAIVGSIDVAPYGDTYRRQRVQSIVQALTERELTLTDLALLLQIADVGVGSVTAREEEVPGTQPMVLRTALRLITGDFADEETGRIDSQRVAQELSDISPETSVQVSRILEFGHRGSAGDTYPLDLEDQSEGTVSWLALIVPAVEALRSGGVLSVDELDSSLHTYLVELLISIFLDAELNRHGAQLIFTTHDSNVLSPASGLDLHREQVWFTEKTPEGATELFSLEDFPAVKDANPEKRYLAGRYGAVPETTPSFIYSLIATKADEVKKAG